MDPPEIERLSQRIDRRLRRLGLSLADREDIRQDVLEDYLLNAHKVRNPVAWVGVVAHRTGIKSKSAYRMLADEKEPVRDWPEEVRIDVRRAFTRSSTQSQDLIFHRFLAGNTIDEFVGRGYGSASTVKRRLRHALIAFRKKMPS